MAISFMLETKDLNYVVVLPLDRALVGKDGVIPRIIPLFLGECNRHSASCLVNLTFGGETPNSNTFIAH